MNLLDMRTVVFSFTISNLICAFVIVELWRHNRTRFTGIRLWVVDFVLQFIAMVLLLLRGIIPEIISMTMSNAMFIGGTILFYIGLQRFLEHRRTQVHNIVFFIVFILVHLYFVFIHPSLTIRNIIFSVSLLFICIQCAVFLFLGVGREWRSFTRGVGVVFIAFCLTSFIRIIADIAVPSGHDLFQSRVYDVTALLFYQMLFIVLTFSVFLMVNKRLFTTLENDITTLTRMEEALRVSEEKFSKAFQASPDAILITRINDGTFIEVNASFEKMSGYTRGETVGGSVKSRSLWIDAGTRDRIIDKLKGHSPVSNEEFDFRTKSGNFIHCLYSGEIINLNGEMCVLSIVRDVTERKKSDAFIRLRLVLWEYAATHSVNEVMQKTLDEIETITSSQIGFYHFVDDFQKALTLAAWSTRTRNDFCKAEGEGMHYPISQAGVWVDCIREKRPVIHNDYASLPHRKGMPEGHAQVIRELVVPTMRDGRVLSVLGVGNKPTEYNDEDIAIVSYIADVVLTIVMQKKADENIHKLNSQLERLAMTDELTGLANRRSFFIQGKEEIKRARRFRTPLTMIMLDIDRFKNINDKYGHEAGDASLKRITKILQMSVREVDVAARLGGEEFGILLPNTNIEAAAILAERLRAMIEAESGYMNESTTISITASIGVASFSQENQNLETLMRDADSAMYQAKNKGRNRVERWSQ